jgi:hypothetical protein
MNLIQRVTNICLNPKTEWPVIEAEPASTAELFKTYIIPLSAIPAVASFIGMTIFGMSIPFMGTIRTPFMAGLTTLILTFGLGLLSTYLISLIINALAPSFGGEKNPLQALKVTAYAFTPAWVAGILQILPSLGIIGLLAGLYSIYVLYLGLPVLMKAPQEKAVGYTAVSVICSIVLMVIIMAVVGALGGMSAMHGARFGATAPEIESNSALGDLAKMGERMAEAGKKMEAAQKSGDSQAQMAAATDALGAALGGDSSFEVVEIARLKALLPESMAGLKRTRFEGEKTSMGNFKISKAEASYSGDDNRNINVTVTDFGGNKMASIMLGWGAIEMDKETEHGYEKMGKVAGRPTKEEYQTNTSSGEYNVLVAGRFMLEVRGQQVDMAAMKAAAASVGYDKLEAMKNEGAKK